MFIKQFIYLSIGSNIILTNFSNRDFMSLDGTKNHLSMNFLKKNLFLRNLTFRSL
jgi:hypothetical protein